jgi:4-diphosphocytidyl-2-C-methyl-D-erythritol kinase
MAAPAKVNLYLHVTGRRDDGYHLLDSLVVFAGISDQLTLMPGDDRTLEVEGTFAEGIGDPADNLVMRAARALADVSGVAGGVTARLEKNIPSAAGLGGGSADAAAALRGLVRLWDIPAEAVNLADIGLALGADIPVCLAAAPSFVGGVGEEIDAAPALPESGLLLVNPGVALSTPAVFAKRRDGFSPPGRFSEAPADTARLADILNERGNDLAEAAISLAPVIGEVLEAIGGIDCCRLARMTGSGATCFGLFDDEAAASRAAKGLQREGWWVRSTRILPGA